MKGKASTLLRNLFFLPLAVFLTGCNISGGGGSFNWAKPGTPGEYSCEYARLAGGVQAWCDTGEHPNLCECE